MVRTVTIDESQSNLLESRLTESATAVEVGLAIGKLAGVTSNRDFIFSLIPTPPNDGVAPASLVSENLESKSGRSDKRRGAKGKTTSNQNSSYVEIDVEWLAEHARQVSKMLLGGLHIVGVYLWATEGTFKNSWLVLFQVRTTNVVTPIASIKTLTTTIQAGVVDRAHVAVKEVARAAQIYANVEGEGRLALHISYSPRRLSCWSCNVNEKFTATSLRPCELKTSMLLSTMQTFVSFYNFDLRLPLSKYDLQTSNGMRETLQRAISLVSQQLEFAEAICNGSLVSENTEVSGSTPHEIKFLLPIENARSSEDEIEEEVPGLLIFRGNVFAQAHVLPRETILHAVAELKKDIISSLQSRLDILCDEVEESVSLPDGNVHDNDGKRVEHPLYSCNWSEACKLVFPRRVLIPWIGVLSICDYMQPTESFQDLHERCKELICMDLPNNYSLIQVPEALEHSLCGTSFWSAISRSNATSISTTEQAVTSEHERDIPRQNRKFVAFKGIYGILAVFAAVLSVLIFFMAPSIQE